MSLTPRQEYEVAVVLQGKDGNWGSPSSVTPTVITPEEFAPFPPPNIPYGVLTRRAVGVEITWEPVRHDSLEYYEVRRGSEAWVGAEVMGRTLQSRLLIPDAGYDTEYYQVRARHRNGLYSPRSLQFISDGGSPAEYPTHVAVLSDGDPTWNGTHTDTTTAADGSLVLAAGKLKGNYVTPELDATTSALRFWSTNWSTWEEEAETVEEATYAVGSGEARWRTVGGREATVYQPGSEFDMVVGGPERVGDLDLRVGGHVGTPGAHTRCKAEVAFDTGAGYGPWLALRNEPRTARKMKVRWTLDRESDRYQVHVNPSPTLRVSGSPP